MKTRTVLSTVGAVLCVLALIVYLWWPWIALKTAPVREAARPGPKQDDVFPLRIDLVTAPTDTPLQLTVPARKTFAVELVNRAPGVDYFWKLTVPQYPSFYTRIQGRRIGTPTRVSNARGPVHPWRLRGGTSSRPLARSRCTRG